MEEREVPKEVFREVLATFVRGIVDARISELLLQQNTVVSESTLPTLNYVCWDEPDAETDAGKVLFVKGVHEGNLRRMFEYVFNLQGWADIPNSTRVWLLYALLIDFGLAPAKQKLFKMFAKYLEDLLKIKLDYDAHNVKDYWRKTLPLVTAQPQAAGPPPQNADHINDFISIIASCIANDERTGVDMCLKGTFPTKVPKVRQDSFETVVDGVIASRRKDAPR